MTRTAVLDYELVVPIFPQGLAFLAWGDFHARSRFARSRFARSLHYSLGKIGTTRSLQLCLPIKSLMTPKDYAGIGNKNMRTKEQKKITRGRMTERKGKSYEENLK